MYAKSSPCTWIFRSLWTLFCYRPSQAAEVFPFCKVRLTFYIILTFLFCYLLSSILVTITLPEIIAWIKNMSFCHRIFWLFCCNHCFEDIFVSSALYISISTNGKCFNHTYSYTAWQSFWIPSLSSFNSHLRHLSNQPFEFG